MTDEERLKAEDRYNSLLLSSHKKLREKQRELENTIKTVVFLGIALLCLWMWHADRMQDKLDNALSDCTVAMSDGTCLERIYR